MFMYLGLYVNVKVLYTVNLSHIFSFKISRSRQFSYNFLHLKKRWITDKTHWRWNLTVTVQFMYLICLKSMISIEKYLWNLILQPLYNTCSTSWRNVNLYHSMLCYTYWVTKPMIVINLIHSSICCKEKRARWDRTVYVCMAK